MTDTPKSKDNRQEVRVTVKTQRMQIALGVVRVLAELDKYNGYVGGEILRIIGSLSR